MSALLVSGLLLPSLIAAQAMPGLAVKAHRDAGAAPGAAFLDKLDRVLIGHPLMRMVDADVATASAQIGVEKSAYYPKFSIGMGVGHQQIERDQGTTGGFNPSEMTLGINQLITDFGHTQARVNAASVVLEKETKERTLQRQNLVLAAIEAQLQVVKAERSLRYAQQSEANIKRQTALESARMEAGKGYATDVLQAKAQLAGAEARRVIADSKMSEALNRYTAVFHETPVNPEQLQALQIPEAFLPKSETDIESIVLAQNPDVIAAGDRARVTSSERDVQRAKELMPRLGLQITQPTYNDYEGVSGNRRDLKAMLRFDWQFDLGMRATRVTDAADQAVASAQEKAAYVSRQALEEAHNAWVSWKTSRQRTLHLLNQVELSEQFLELARRERELGRRSLLDILNGEVARINAQSEAVSAKVDEVIASYRLLRSVGGLSVDIIRAPGMVIDAEELLPSILGNKAGRPAKVAAVDSPVVSPITAIVQAPAAIKQPAQNRQTPTLPPAQAAQDASGADAKKVEPSAARADLASTQSAVVQPQSGGIKITAWRFVGNAAFDDKVLGAVLADLLGQDTSVAQLEVAAKRVTDFYASKGRRTVKAQATGFSQDGTVALVVRKR